VYDIGLRLAIVCSQLGMRSIGKNALLAKVNGKFSRFIIAIGVSALVERKFIAMKSDERPMQTRNIMAKTPRRFKGLKLAPKVNPRGIAISNMINA
jgi:hypothetical protein